MEVGRWPRREGCPQDLLSQASSQAEAGTPSVSALRPGKGKAGQRGSQSASREEEKFPYFPGMVGGRGEPTDICF